MGKVNYLVATLNVDWATLTSGIIEKKSIKWEQTGAPINKVLAESSGSTYSYTFHSNMAWTSYLHILAGTLRRTSNSATGYFAWAMYKTNYSNNTTNYNKHTIFEDGNMGEFDITTLSDGFTVGVTSGAIQARLVDIFIV